MSGVLGISGLWYRGLLTLELEEEDEEELALTDLGGRARELRHLELHD